MEQVVALGQLRNTFGMGKREAEDIMQEVTVKIYRRMLAKAVQNGDLDAAPSKAMFLQNLCDTLQFDPVKAGEVHEGNILKLARIYVIASLYNVHVLVSVN